MARSGRNVSEDYISAAEVARHVGGRLREMLPSFNVQRDNDARAECALGRHCLVGRERQVRRTDFPHPCGAHEQHRDPHVKRAATAAAPS